MIVGEGLPLAALGLAIGLALALPAGGLVASLLFGVRPADPPTFALVAALFLAVAAVASGGPAVRAARVLPAEVLRQE